MVIFHLPRRITRRQGLSHCLSLPSVHVHHPLHGRNFSHKRQVARAWLAGRVFPLLGKSILTWRKTNKFDIRLLTDDPGLFVSCLCLIPRHLPRLVGGTGGLQTKPWVGGAGSSGTYQHSRGRHRSWQIYEYRANLVYNAQDSQSCYIEKLRLKNKQTNKQTNQKHQKT